MFPKSPFFFLLLFFSLSSAHNITRILSVRPKFSSFNSLLSSANLAGEINRRSTITILAVSNDSIPNSLFSLSSDQLRHILSVHVILDYFDLDKLQNLKNHSAILTTLFQTSGVAESRTGFLNVTKLADGRIEFRSAEAGADLAAELVGPILARPYNLSILQVTSLIIPPGFDVFELNNTIPPSPLPSAPIVAEAPAIAVEAPEAADDSYASPIASPEANSPPADSPPADSPKGDVDEEVKSGAVSLGLFDGYIGVVMILIGLI